MGEGRRGGGETRSEKRLSGLSLSVWWQSEPGMLATRDSGRSRPPHLSGTPWLSRWPSMPHPVRLLRTGADLTEDLLRRCRQPGPRFPLTQQHFTIPCTGMGLLGAGGAFAKEAKACRQSGILEGIHLCLLYFCGSNGTDVTPCLPSSEALTKTSIPGTQDTSRPLAKEFSILDSTST